MKNIFLILLVFAAGHVGAGEATVQFRIRGLFDPQRVEDLKRMTAGIADFRIVALDYDSATATFAYADDKPPFKGAKPESVERGFRERSYRARSFFREGRAGAWRDHLTPAQVERIIADHGSAMARLGYLPLDPAPSETST